MFSPQEVRRERIATAVFAALLVDSRMQLVDYKAVSHDAVQAADALIKALDGK